MEWNAIDGQIHILLNGVLVPHYAGMWLKSIKAL